VAQPWSLSPLLITITPTRNAKCRQKNKASKSIEDLREAGADIDNRDGVLCDLALA
jgi:hypothetical protein